MNMNNDLTKAIHILKEKQCTCVLCKNDMVYTCKQRGVKPLLDWMDSGLALKDFSAADKVVGKAAAFLYVLLGVKEIYADVISESAVAILKRYDVKVQYGELVEYIINRAGTGKCPMEDAVWDISVPDEAVAAVRTRLKDLTKIRIINNKNA